MSKKQVRDDWWILSPWSCRREHLSCRREDDLEQRCSPQLKKEADTLYILKKKRRTKFRASNRAYFFLLFANLLCFPVTNQGSSFLFPFWNFQFSKSSRLPKLFIDMSSLILSKKTQLGIILLYMHLPSFMCVQNIASGCEGY